jgi:thioredoxin 2
MKTYTVCGECLTVNRVDLEKAAGNEPVCGSCKKPLSLNGAVTETTASGLNALSEKSPLPVVVDFWAPWCAPCRSFAPVYLQAAQELCETFTFAKVDTQAHPLAADAFHIQSSPTLVLSHKGLERDRVSGAMPPEQFKDWLLSHLSQ